MQKITTSSTYRGYTINTGKNNNLPCNTKTLDQLDQPRFFVPG